MTERQNELRCLIRLQGVLGAGNGRAEEILSAFGGAENIFDSGDGKRVASGLFTVKELERANRITPDYDEKILTECCDSGIRVTAITDFDFPDRLRNIPAAPLVLYSKGTLPDVDREPLFCIVGPRLVSDFGAKAAYSLAARLAKAGMPIVSGGAVGSDTCAHKGALKNGGRTIAVLACGIDSGYLPENRGLREEIACNGCLVSEYPPSASVRKYHFQARNRLMSGLAVGTAVIEAGERSGALITAHHAAEQGRDVFVIPGNPTLPQYKGSNALLRDGARPLLDASDIFNEYLPQFPDKIDLERAFLIQQNHAPQAIVKKKFNEGLSKDAKIVYNQLNKQKFTADDLAGTGLADDALISALTELEIEQYIKALPGGFYTLI